MRIFLKHYSQVKKIKTSWIYIGNKFQKLENCRKKSNKKNEDLSNKTRKIFNTLEFQYFEWIEQQRLLNKDSLEWWMTDIANGNTMISNLYLFLCQIKSLKEYLGSLDHKKDHKITIICEDIFIYLAVKENLENYKFDENRYTIIFLSFYEKIYLKLRSIINLYIQFKYLFAAYYYSRVTRPKKLDLPIGDITLFHQTLHVKKIKEDFEISGEYHKFLPRWFQRNNKNVFQICIDYDLDIDKKLFFSILRDQNFFMPDDWLNIKDYFNVFLRSLKSYHTLSYSIDYPKFKIRQLVKRERYYQRFTKGLYFLRYIPAIKKWARDINTINYFDMYESTIYQHPLNQAINELNEKNITNGLIHHYVSKEYFGHYTHRNEWKSTIKPKRIFCHSKLYRDILIKRNFPNQIIHLAPPIRSRFIQAERKKKNKKYLLVNLPLLHDALGEIILCLSAINDKIREELDLNILLRPHPRTPYSKISELINKKELPSNWKLVSGNFYDLLDDAFCCLCMSSASVYDAINNFSIVISLKSEINIMDNYLDIIEDKFNILKSVNKSDLYDKIKDIYFNKTEHYIREFDQIRDFLKEQSLDLNEKNMQVFKTNNI